MRFLLQSSVAVQLKVQVSVVWCSQDNTGRPGLRTCTLCCSLCGWLHVLQLDLPALAAIACALYTALHALSHRLASSGAGHAAFSVKSSSSEVPTRS